MFRSFVIPAKAGHAKIAPALNRSFTRLIKFIKSAGVAKFKAILVAAILPTTIMATKVDALQVEATSRDSFSQAISKLKQIDLHAVGHAEAVAAIEALDDFDADRLSELLSAMSNANPVARNWIRGLAYTLVDRQPADHRQRLLLQAKTVFENPQFGDAARELAYELICKLDPESADKIQPRLIDDSSVKLIAKGVAWHLQQLDLASEATERLGRLSMILSKAVDVNQIQSAAEQLKDLGVSIDLNRQLGFLTSWHIVAGFENPMEEGISTTYPPEKDLSELNLKETYLIDDNRQAGWVRHHTDSPLGVIDLNQVVGQIPNQVAFATTSFELGQATKGQLKIASPNAIQVWVNGTLQLTNEIYHNGNAIDKFKIPVEFQSGKNTIVIKVCQNDRPESWAKAWEFRLRVCDIQGRALQVNQSGNRPAAQ